MLSFQIQLSSHHKKHLILSWEDTGTLQPYVLAILIGYHHPSTFQAHRSHESEEGKQQICKMLLCTQLLK